MTDDVSPPSPTSTDYKTNPRLDCSGILPDHELYRFLFGNARSAPTERREVQWGRDAAVERGILGEEVVPVQFWNRTRTGPEPSAENDRPSRVGPNRLHPYRRRHASVPTLGFGSELFQPRTHDDAQLPIHCATISNPRGATWQRDWKRPGAACQILVEIVRVGHAVQGGYIGGAL